MPTLSKRERKLAILFGATIFLVANLAIVAALWRKQNELRANLEALRLQQTQAESLLADKDTWRQRKQLLANMPELASPGAANADLMDALTASAAKDSVTIIDRGFVPPDAAHQADYQEIAVRLKISGPHEAITRWLAETQQPAKFQAIPSLSMKLDNDPSKIVCELTVARYYAPVQ